MEGEGEGKSVVAFPAAARAFVKAPFFFASCCECLLLPEQELPGDGNACGMARVCALCVAGGRASRTRHGRTIVLKKDLADAWTPAAPQVAKSATFSCRTGYRQWLAGWQVLWLQPRARDPGKITPPGPRLQACNS